MQRDIALAAQEAKMKAGAMLMQCEDCGEDIPEARRRAVTGCRRCVPCQSERERMR
ncbi:TraR/DksA C4-type zinc finger protein [Craterilacuibacter sp. RT1T]|nr:TraR/DksA C4-type zinc finger protein [Craterilacuibacter sp. RT1T]